MWVSPPANAETWPGCLDEARAAFAYFVEQLQRYTPVRDVAELGIETEDAWIRDYGPMFVIDGGQPVIVDFGYNAWGEKYGDGKIDNRVPRLLAEALGLSCMTVDLVLEGGGIECDGQGVGLTTASCLFHPSRNGDMPRQQVADTVCKALGFSTLHMLPGGDLPGDDTDGHIDNIARFLSPTQIVMADPAAARAAGVDETVAAMLERNLTAARELRTLEGEAYDLLLLPVPEPIHFDYPGDRWTPARRETLPTSYINFLVSNGALFLPVFGQSADDVAIRCLEAAGLGLDIVPIPSRTLLVGQGGLHCLTQQQPAVAS